MEEKKSPRDGLYRDNSGQLDDINIHGAVGSHEFRENG